MGKGKEPPEFKGNVRYRIGAVQAKKHVTVYPIKISGPTDIEEILRKSLIQQGYKESQDFFREYSAEGYFLDFAFTKEKLDVEADEEYWHAKRRAEDSKRDSILKKKGWKVLRFSGYRIKRDLSRVIQEITNALTERSKV